MAGERLIFAVLDTAKDIGDAELAARLRDLTIAWSRFKYFDRILEADSVDALLAAALEAGASHCFIQAYGSILTEVWHPERSESRDVMTALTYWLKTEGLFAAGIVTEDADGQRRLSPQCLLVNLDHYQALGQPPFQATGAPFFAAAEAKALTVRPFPPDIAAGLVYLEPEKPGRAAALKRLLGSGIAAYDKSASPFPESGQQQFLQSMQTLTQNLQRGVFLWNIESYTDVEQPPEDFNPPLDTLYSVAAGFKPNRILATHGFDAESRLVVFDYSAQGLAFRRMLQEDWDGRDYPAFLHRLFKRLPSSEAHYLLWHGVTPETLDWRDVESRWQQELTAWGGAAALEDHWDRFKTIRVDYLHCNLLEGAPQLLAELRDERNAVIWWSNAFFSIYSNWFLGAAERQNIYREWIAALAQRAPDLFLYGADSNNVSVNFVRAAPYWDWYRTAGGDDLAPGKYHRHELRF